MAKRLRAQFKGAVYHVINRGSYQRDLLETADKAKAFERALFETCGRMGWKLFAFVLMRNHFHLAIETTELNLVDGMHCLQTTFAMRFNRFGSERGHLFQGRYQAISVEPGVSILRVVNYIHLNPVRAGIVAADQVGNFRWSSLRHYLGSRKPTCLTAEQWLPLTGCTVSNSGIAAYRDALANLAAKNDFATAADVGAESAIK